MGPRPDLSVGVALLREVDGQGGFLAGQGGGVLGGRLRVPRFDGPGELQAKLL